MTAAILVILLALALGGGVGAVVMIGGAGKASVPGDRYLRAAHKAFNGEGETPAVIEGMFRRA